MRYHWARRGDVNAFFGLMLDNVAVMVTLVSLLTVVGGFDANFVLTRMIPGTALGVVLGDVVYTWMAFRLARRSGRDDVTAMPLGLDTPSTFGVAFLVLIPAHNLGKDLYGPGERAMEFAWHVGLVTLVLVGVFKTLLAPLGNLVRRLVPRAGLLGSLAAIAIALIAFLPLLDGIGPLPLVGMLSLAVILLTLVAHRELPFKLPGALAAVLLGVLVYWLGWLLTHAFGWPLVSKPAEGEPLAAVNWSAIGAVYDRSAAWYGEVFKTALARLPVVLPFAVATIVGGIDCTESAASAGDEYDTRAILLTEGLASLLAGLLGGVLQTTPYIGHPAYKKMGGRAAYTLATALFIGVVGCLGGFGYLFAWLPRAALYPILVFVGLEIMAQSFHATPTKHYPALAIAMLPALAYLILIPVKQVMALGPTLTDEARMTVQTLRCLANGFIVTSLLWAAALAMLLDGRLKAAAVYLAVTGLCAFFGVIHSPLADERVGLPHTIMAQFQKPTLLTSASTVGVLGSPLGQGPLLAAAALLPGRTHEPFADAVAFQTPYHWAATYGLMALLFWGLSLARPAPGDAPAESKDAVSEGTAVPPDGARDKVRRSDRYSP